MFRWRWRWRWRCWSCLPSSSYIYHGCCSVCLCWTSALKIGFNDTVIVSCTLPSTYMSLKLKLKIIFKMSYISLLSDESTLTLPVIVCTYERHIVVLYFSLHGIFLYSRNNLGSLLSLTLN